MANFCTKCGRPLPENGICECQTAQAQQAPQPAAAPQGPAYAQQPYQQAPYYAPQPAAPGPFVTALKNIVPFAKAFVKDPAAAVKQVVEENNTMFSLVMMLVLAVASLFAWLTASVGLELYSDIGVTPVLLPLLFSLIFTVVILGLGTLGVYFSARAAKKEVSMMQALIAVGAGSIVPAAILAVAILFNLYFPIGVFLAAFLAFATTLTDCVIALKVFDGHKMAAVAALGLLAAIGLLFGGYLYYQGIIREMLKGAFSSMWSWMY